MTTPRLSALHIYPVKSFRGRAPKEVGVEPWGLAGDRRWMVVDAMGRFVTQRERPELALVDAEPTQDGGLRLGGPGREVLTVPVPVTAPLSGATVPVTVWGDKVEAVPAGDAAAAWLSAYLGTEAALVYLDDPARRRPVDPEFALPGDSVNFADGFPLLLTTTGSLDALNSLIARGDRSAEGPLPMDRFRPNAVIDGTAPWAEDGWRRIRIGEVAFRVVKPCGRCVITTTDQRTGERGREPLRTLARHRRVGGQLVFGQNLIPEHPGTLRVGDALFVMD
ncbi:MOSC domain-containing protein [Actinacidiphila soli]|jgi:uncharacterized protein YcbX|uniref:MOSC domain-containing protein n=1 Tax=Actinacidiphila soli TaxID=2487275 RepID=UPI000FCABAC1|nr:MOSC N-terminal beta barrel domain-containing protein [Actinacidiphila soli]